MSISLKSSPLRKKITWQVKPKARAWQALGLTFVAGGLLNFAFAPYRALWLAPLVLAVLYRVLLSGSWRQAFARGFMFGVGLFLFGVSWTYSTLERFGGMPAPVAAIACGIFMAILAAYIGLVAAAFARLRTGTDFDPWLFAALWVMGEWVRGTFLTGFPWLDLGYAATYPTLLPWAAVIGVLGLSFVVALAGALVAEAVRGRTVGLLAILIFLLASPLVTRLSFVHPTGRAVTASLIQGDISPNVKWDPDTQDAIIHRYWKLTQKSDGVLVVWPETAVPEFSHDLRRHFIPRLKRWAEINHRHFLFGLIEGDEASDGPIYNAVMSVGRHDGFYRKRHLVPFGEYLPWPALLNPILNVLHIPMASFTAWPTREGALKAAGLRLGLSICYEVAYGSLVTQALPQATLLVNVSDDSWYGHSNEAHQQLQIAQVRAAEAGRDMLIATNDGVTALIGHTGRIVARLPPFRPGVLTVVVRSYQGLTPYDRIGNKGILLFAALLLSWGMVFLWRRKSLSMRP